MSIPPQTVIFTRPRCVTVSKTPPPEPSTPHAKVKTLYSAVSTGTELLVYTGCMPTSIPLDASFSHNSEPFTYPASYGYATVGVIVSAPTLPPGTRVFAFREHTSVFYEVEHNLMQIPDDVSTKDALFLPNVETALSLIMDARIHPGENVCVIGQGMVGLLVVSLLRHTNPYARILSLDPNKARRDISHTNARAHVTLDPTHATFREDLHKTFPSLADVSIEVSASSSGLQTAIDTTRDHGRVVVGSWFGEKGCVLGNLGGRFHRSHMTLVSSQVSSITPVLGSRWDKERRFALVWKLIRDIKPISVFPVCVVGVERAGEMYERLLVGDVLQVIFEYAQA